ncbi:hypothetical protein BG000_012084, partial [Podila horticola]
MYTVSTNNSPAPSTSSESDGSPVSSPEIAASGSTFTNKVEQFTVLLENDVRVKVAGVDLDGILRGKVMAKSKFLSILESGFGFCSVIFGWDMHDKTYAEELSISNAANETPDTLATKGHTAPQALTPGMFGYSLLRPTLHQDYFYGIFDQCKEFGVNIESFHTETGPGVYEAALSYDTATRMADMANLFKLSVKQLGIKQGIMPTFMAKPYGDQPGCSGHIHFSIRDLATKTNL